MLFSEMLQQGEYEDGQFTPAMVDLDNNDMFDFIKNFEDGINAKKKKRKKGLEVFLDEEPPEPPKEVDL